MIPHLFSKHPIPTDPNKELDTIIQELAVCGNKEEFLKNAFYYVVNKWGGNRYLIFSNLHRLGQTDIGLIIESPGYLHCTTMNYILRIMLIRSGFYNEGDIQPRLTHTWYLSPHQYLQIHIGDGIYNDIDPWSYQFGIEYGKFGKGFDSIAILSVKKNLQ